MDLVIKEALERGEYPFFLYLVEGTKDEGETYSQTAIVGLGMPPEDFHLDRMPEITRSTMQYLCNLFEIQRHQEPFQATILFVLSPAKHGVIKRKWDEIHHNEHLFTVASIDPQREIESN